MPLFYTPKPRQFHYTPRFYDPEKEKWEALKHKYDNAPDGAAADMTPAADAADVDEELSYFQSRVRDIEREEKQEKSRFTWRDLFRKREMPTFNYKPRFVDGVDTHQSAEASADDASEVLERYSSEDMQRRVRIKHRFDFDSPEYMKPVSGSRIIIYVLLTCLLLYWILF